MTQGSVERERDAGTEKLRIEKGQGILDAIQIDIFEKISEDASLPILQQKDEQTLSRILTGDIRQFRGDSAYGQAADAFTISRQQKAAGHAGEIAAEEFLDCVIRASGSHDVDHRFV